MAADTVFPEKRRGAAGGFDIEAETAEEPDQRKKFLFVMIIHGSKDCPMVRDPHACRLHRLVEGMETVPVIADGFAGGLHLRGEIGVHAAELRKRESGRLNKISGILRRRGEVGDPLFPERMTQHAESRDIRQMVPGGLG